MNLKVFGTRFKLCVRSQSEREILSFHILKRNPR